MKLSLHSAEFSDAVILSVEAGTNCPQGGDAGHGGRTLLRIRSVGATMECRLDGGPSVPIFEFEILLGGDAEHRVLTKALQFALGVLESQFNSQLMTLETREVELD